MKAELFISRLDRVKTTGKGSWLACCPAHEDRSPSMTVRDVGDRVLIHCFAGCSPEAILAAVGMEFSDLYAEVLPRFGASLRRPFPAADTLEAVSGEALLIAVAGADAVRLAEFCVKSFESHAITNTGDFDHTEAIYKAAQKVLADRERVLLACSRIEEARSLANG